MSKFKIFAKSISIPLIVNGIVGLIISGSFDYNSLPKPTLAPPSIFFPIIWSILYILMGTSYGILESKSLINKNLNIIYYSQLFVNALWPILFFILKGRLLSFIWLILLDVLIITMLLKFYKKNKTAGLLQLPYLLWSLFASYLNLSIYLLNK